MALMPGTPVFLLSTILLAGGLAGCETVTTAPTDSHLAGSWNLDKAASDNPEAKIAAAMSVAQAKLKHRLARYGNDPDDTRAAAAGDAPDAPDYTYDTPEDYRYGIPGRVGPDFRGLRSQLRQELIPPNSLQLDVAGDLVTISSDQMPPRDYRLGERVSRIDEYGTAIISVTWSHEMFELNYKYTSHASHSETYQVDPATGALAVTEEVSDPTVGRITLRSVYRRGAPANS
jgi:hypothetical protein